MSRRYSVVIAGYYGFGNLGDELICSALVDCLIRHGIPKDEIAVLSKDPVACAASLGVYAHSRWSMVSVMSAFLKSRTLLLGGGGLFQDSTSVRSCMYYGWLCRMSRSAGCVPWMFGQSLGPLKTATGRDIAIKAYSGCSVRYVRDSASVDLAASLSLAVDCAPDTVFSLSVPQCGCKSGPLGVNLRQWRPDDIRAACGEIRTLACDRPLVGIAMSGDDVKVMEQAISKRWLDISDIKQVMSISDFVENAATLSGVVAMRLHCVILSMMSGLPTAAISYDPKVGSLAASWDVPYWTCEDGWSGGTPEMRTAAHGKIEAAGDSVRKAMGTALGRLGLINV